MMSRFRRTRSPAIKAKVALAAIKGKKTLADRAQQLDAHPNQNVQWCSQLLGRAAGVFGSEAQSEHAAPSIDVKALHAKIEELALANGASRSRVSPLRYPARSTRQAF